MDLFQKKSLKFLTKREFNRQLIDYWCPEVDDDNAHLLKVYDKDGVLLLRCSTCGYCRTVYESLVSKLGPNADFNDIIKEAPNPVIIAKASKMLKLMEHFERGRSYFFSLELEQIPFGDWAFFEPNDMLVMLSYLDANRVFNEPVLCRLTRDIFGRPIQLHVFSCQFRFIRKFTIEQGFRVSYPRWADFKNLDRVIATPNRSLAYRLQASMSEYWDETIPIFVMEETSRCLELSYSPFKTIHLLLANEKTEVGLPFVFPNHVDIRINRIPYQGDNWNKMWNKKGTILRQQNQIRFLDFLVWEISKSGKAEAVSRLAECIDQKTVALETKLLLVDLIESKMNHPIRHLFAESLGLYRYKEVCTDYRRSNLTYQRRSRYSVMSWKTVSNFTVDIVEVVERRCSLSFTLRLNCGGKQVQFKVMRGTFESPEKLFKVLTMVAFKNQMPLPTISAWARRHLSNIIKST